MWMHKVTGLGAGLHVAKKWGFHQGPKMRSTLGRTGRQAVSPCYRIALAMAMPATISFWPESLIVTTMESKVSHDEHGRR